MDIDEPLTVWYCDTCGGRIEDVNRAYVIWRTRPDPGDFKIIHQAQCDQGDHTSSMPLQRFLGAPGLSYALTFLDAGPILKELAGSSEQQVPELHGFVDFLRRVQVPHYEQARRSFSRWEILDAHADWTPSAPYAPDALREIARRAAEQAP